LGSSVPLRRCRRGPLQSSRHEIVPAIAEHLQEGVIGLDDRAVELRDNDPDDVGVDESPNPGFALLLRKNETGHRRSTDAKSAHCVYSGFLIFAGIDRPMRYRHTQSRIQ